MPRTVSSRVSGRSASVRSEWQRAQPTTGALRWLILASLGVVAQGACGGRSLPNEDGIDDFPGEGARGGEGGNAGARNEPYGGSGGSERGGAAGYGGSGYGGSGYAGYAGSAIAGASGSSFGGYAGSAMAGAAGVAGAAGAAGSGGAPSVVPAVCYSAVVLGGGAVQCANGMVQRPFAGECDNDLPRAEPLAPEELLEREQSAIDLGLTPEETAALFPCRADTDCTERENGYCSFTTNDGLWAGGDFTFCRYACTSDADCGGGTLCECGSPGGQCVTANCNSNEDCGVGSGVRCTRYDAGAGCYDQPIPAWQCQTPYDSCLVDADCAPGSLCYPDYSAVRRCQPTQDCPTPGRPFTVGGDARHADASDRPDWSFAVGAPELSQRLDAGYDPALRAELADAWAEIGLMEHASVASFARFALELMAVGAPPELLDATARAMQDETRHARLCFAIARRHGREVGPGRLNIEDAIPPFDFEQMVLRAVREGCIAETASALEVAEAAEHCSDAPTRAALESIARDEAQHAALAWRFVVWALSRSPRSLIEQVRETFAAELSRLGEPLRAASAHDQALAAFGIVGTSEREKIRRRALKETIAPSSEIMLARALGHKFN